MKIALTSVVTFVLCGGLAIGDLEIYPESRSFAPEHHQEYFRKPENGYYPHPPLLPFAIQPRNRYFDLSWPSIAAQTFREHPDLANRIALIAKQLEEMNQKHAALQAIPPPRDHSFLKMQQMLDRYPPELDPNVLKMQRTLDQFRPDLDPVAGSELSARYASSGRNLQNEVVDEAVEHSERNGGSRQAKQDDRFHVEVDDPAEFAYAPSDPRYFEDNSLTPDMKSSTSMKYLPGNTEEYVQIQHRTDESLYDRLDLGDVGKLGKPDDVIAVEIQPQSSKEAFGIYIIAIVAGVSAAATVGLIAFAVGWYNFSKHAKNATDVEYPAYGVTGPNKDVSPSGDNRLAQSAQMYHYQHQKQQIIAMERAATADRHGSVSEVESDEDNEEGDYTVYECPGLAPAGEMEVKNPLFQDDPTPAHTAASKTAQDHIQNKK